MGLAGSQVGSQRWQILGDARPRPATVGAAQWHIGPLQPHLATSGECLLSSRPQVRILLGAQFRSRFWLLCSSCGSHPESRCALVASALLAPGGGRSSRPGPECRVSWLMCVTQGELISEMDPCASKQIDYERLPGVSGPQVSVCRAAGSGRDSGGTRSGGREQVTRWLAWA